MKTRRPTLPPSPPRGQRGITLLVAMIILIMVTLLAVSAFRVSNTNLKVVSAMQGRQEAVAASQSVIELTISSPFFSENPTIVAATPYPVDINGDGANDYSVTLAVPTCQRARPVVPAQLNLNDVNDRQCLGSARVAAAGATTYCSDTIWEMAATTSDKLSGATTTVRQGVALRVDTTDARNACR